MKIYIRFLSFLSVLVLILCFSACRKTPITNTAVTGQVYSFYNHPYIQNTAGEILFQANNAANDPFIKNAASLFGGFDSINNTMTGRGATVNIAGYNISPIPNIIYNLGYDSLYGRVISYL